MDVRISVSGGPPVSLQMPEAPRVGDDLQVGGQRLQITSVIWIGQGPGGPWFVGLLAQAAGPVVASFGP